MRRFLIAQTAILLAAILLAPCAAMAQDSAHWSASESAPETAPARPAGDSVALTFDDLPALTLLKTQATTDDSNTRILRGLKQYHMPAIGFVNEDKLNDGNRAHQIANLKMWLDAGMDLGNHTYSHETPNTLSARAYINDIARGERVTRPMMASYGKTLTWFRYPYLETGPTLKKKAAIQNWLKAHGYRIAPVTMENSDWMFAEPYDDAIAHHQDARIQRIRAEYLAFTDYMVGWYQDAGHALFGRPMAFVMLMHVSRLNADCIDDLAAIIQRHGLKTVTLDEALKDPAYATPDPYVGKDGDEWLERWAPVLHKELPWDSFREPPVDIEAEYRKVDNDLG